MDTEARKEYRRKYYQANRGRVDGYSKKWRKANPARIKAYWQSQQRDKEKSRIYENRIRCKRREFIRMQKIGIICARCGETNIDKLCFHHVDPTTKKFKVGCVTHHSERTILEEIAKCILLCKSCHGRHHQLHKRC